MVGPHSFRELSAFSRRLRDFLRRRPLAGFLCLAYLWSWMWWGLILIGIWFDALRSPAPAWRGIPYWMICAAFIGGWGPTFSALIVSASTGGRKEVRNLLRRCMLWRLPPGWYLTAWLLPPLVMAAGLMLFHLLGNEVGPFAPGRWTIALLALAVSLPAGPLGEELGWRGFLLPRMEQTFGALPSSLLIGVLWWSWHLPLFWAPMGTTVSGTAVTLWAVAKYLAYVVGLSVVFTWLFNDTGGSILIVIILHLTVNADLVTLFFPQLTTGDMRTIRELSTIPLWGVVFTLIAVYGPGRLARQRR